MKKLFQNQFYSQNSTEENNEESLEGASADDVDAEVITETLENKITMGDGFLAQFLWVTIFQVINFRVQIFNLKFLFPAIG